MVRFRPHQMRLVRRYQGSYDQNGDWQEGYIYYGNTLRLLAAENEALIITEDGKHTIDLTTMAGIPCRYEPNGAAQTITLPDGSAYRYSYTIYLSVDPKLKIQYGDLIELISQDGIILAEEPFEVRGFHRGQLDMKVWV